MAKSVFSKLSETTTWITEAALAHPQGLAVHLAQRLGLCRSGARRLLRSLVDNQWLSRSGPRNRPVYRPGLLRQVVRRYALSGLQEDAPWSRDFAPNFALPPAVARMLQHGFTELVNNAVDHSGGKQVVVSMRQTPSQVQLLVSDDGRGLFEVIGEHFQINDPACAMLELAKGKLTSLPARHSGRGLYFTARIADVLDLHANAAGYSQRGWDPDQWLAVRPACRGGTSVYLAISLDTERTLDQVLRRHSLDGQGYRFERTSVPLRLLAGPAAVLESRAQARRVAQRLDQFRRVDMDFSGVAEVGHAFADELFRVCGPACAGTEIAPVQMAPQVAAMVATVRQATPA